MSDKEEERSQGVEVEETKPPTPMAEAEETQQQQLQVNTRTKLEKTIASFSIWPPTQHTREAVAKRLVETLSTNSILSKRYGSMPADEASSAAYKIEEEAFSVASDAAASSTAENDGIDILQLYSREISKRMLETVKTRAATASPTDNSSPVSVAADSPAIPPACEEISSAQTDS